MKLNNCRFCNKPLSKILIDLGECPLSNSFLELKNLHLKEKSYPLRVLICDNCSLVQTQDFVSPQEIFSEYAYFSSYSRSFLEHSKEYVDKIISRLHLNEKSLVIEIASNDGYLLQYFKKRNIPILGIEPAGNIAEVAEKKGIHTINRFFGMKLAEDLSNSRYEADLLIGNNVLAHVPQLNDFVSGMRKILKPNGIITMEFPHLLQMMKENQFDTIYHEHFSYFSFEAVKKIFHFHKLEIFDVEKIPTHGGSLKIFAKHLENSKHQISKSVFSLLEEEKLFGLTTPSRLDNFSKKAEQIKDDLNDLISKAKNESKKIVCYGAPAKGNTLLNFCKIDSSSIDYAVDLNPYKQGLFLPGSHIPIKPPELIKKTKPDYVLILPWNLKEEIISQMKFIRNWRGKFVTPIPNVEVI